MGEGGGEVNLPVYDPRKSRGWVLAFKRSAVQFSARISDIIKFPVLFPSFSRQMAELYL